MKCWNCNNLEQASFCGENFDLNKISAQDIVNHYLPCGGGKCLKAVAFENGGKYQRFITCILKCNLKTLANFRSSLFNFVCLDEGVQAVIRYCTVSDIFAQTKCKQLENHARAVDVTNPEVHCTTCDTDGCNGAFACRPFVLFVVGLPVAIAKFLSF